VVIVIVETVEASLTEVVVVVAVSVVLMTVVNAEDLNLVSVVLLLNSLLSHHSLPTLPTYHSTQMKMIWLIFSQT
jgi:hypothetical protein